MKQNCPLVTWIDIQKKIKTYINNNMHDGEDRTGAKNDSVTITPDELEGLVIDVCKDVVIPMFNDHVKNCRNHILKAKEQIDIIEKRLK